MGSSDASNSAEPKSHRILLVEDDTRTLRLEQFVLEEEGFEVIYAQSGEKGLQTLGNTGADLVLLDVGLPGIDEFTVCQRIREFSLVPIIMVTAEDRDEDKVRGLEVGADDYVTKPFSTSELAARVKAVLRRSEFAAHPPAPRITSNEPVPLDDTDPSDDLGANDASPQPPPSIDIDVYEGNIRLMVKTTGSIRRMISFVDELRQNPQFQLLRLVANQRNGGMDILLRLEEPMRVKPTLLQMKEVSHVETPEEPPTPGEERLLHVSLGG
jgi:CheY-like chemotaxis protein